MTADVPALTVAVPVFNGENYLRQALDSLLAQTYSDFDLLIVDNASTDTTPDIASEYGERDPRVRYHRNKSNIGAAANWFHALDLCATRYFKWAAHDDLYAPEFLERCVDALERDPSVVACFSRTVPISGEGKIIRIDQLETQVDTMSSRPDERLYNILGHDYLCVQMYAVMRTAVLKATRPYIGYIGWDWNTLAELALLGRIAEVNAPLFYHRLHDLAFGIALNSGRPRGELVQYDPTINWQTDRSMVPRVRNYFGAVHRAPLTAVQRACCYAQLVRLLSEKSARRVRSSIKAVLSLS